ncbi:RNB-domain-containing protein [Aspergillus heteromorphus CBS 117.55]|uniref:RNB-domain-containing protein n=1 Tax=Aspergillus heteromorphus CBS 117.55 TaxID=1448321 RepID=A0A317VVP2_9EURO|nr:RNB-domain-containing protein [Aspergillus heteromorphus CBS 117.55]PWY77057.1 RNB-domain-containing protein [Aspergillus heteromorphus CBS 117.55]
MTSDSNSTFQIHYFASASSYTGKQTERLAAPLPLSQLFDTLEALYPGIREAVLTSCGVSLGEEYVDVEDKESGVVIAEGDEVAVIPPTPSLDEDLLDPSTDVLNNPLKKEFDEHKNIRSYLLKWQASAVNSMDPVRGPGTSNPLDPSVPWVGNMLNDSRETHDNASDALRIGDEALNFDNAADEGEGLGQYLEPGDLVAMSSGDGPLTFAIYLRSIHKQQQFYTDRGKWRISFPKDLAYVVKGFVSPDLLEPLFPHLPDVAAQMQTELQSIIEGGIPRKAGAHLLKKIDQFDRDTQDLYRENSARLDRIHEIVADQTEYREYTLEELTCKALEIEPHQLTDVYLFLIHRLTHMHSFYIECDRSSLFTNYYLVKPLRVAQNIDQVTQWVHEHQDHLYQSVHGKGSPHFQAHPLQKFIQKAQRLIKLSRSVRAPTTMSCVGPTGQRFDLSQEDIRSAYREIPTEPFSDTDRMIIEYLQMWCLPPRRMASGSMRSAGSHIMRSTGMYGTVDLNPLTGNLFLQELGVFYPWDNLRLFDQGLALPGHGTSPSSDDAAWKEVQQECEQLGSEVLPDKMHDVRTDWGDLPVYCVDDVTAEEIDDGVSLERIPGSDDTFWIRIHVANPTAFIDPEGATMKYAASRVQTFYSPERTYPMIPSSLTQKHFSLAAGRPTLTFSAKMNLQGEVLDMNVSNGTVNNVIYITHDKLRSLFVSDAGKHLEPLTVGGAMPKKIFREGLQEELAPEDEENFHIMRKLMLAFREYRHKNGAMEWPFQTNISVSMAVGHEPLKPSSFEATQGRYIIGDPIIQLAQQQVDPHEVVDTSKYDLISLLMNMGCWVSGKWLAERNIPSVYNGTYYHPEYAQVTSTNMSEYGGKQWLELAPPKGITSSSPLKHTPLGLDTYVKSTSPLRRYSDVIAHYQIEAALRFEHENGRRLDAQTDGSALPFSRDYVDQYLSSTRWKSNRLRDCDKHSKQFWACMLMFRAFYFAECPLPETFECLIHRPFSNTSLAGTPYGHGYAAVMPSTGVRCQVLIPKDMAETADLDILSTVEAKITAVDMARTMVVMEATRVIKPFERTGEWQ